MSGKRLCMAVLVFVTVLAGLAVGQDEKNEVGGMLGRIFISDQGIRGAAVPSIVAYGKGISLEGTYARRLLVTPLFAVSGEGLFVFNPDEDVNGGSYGNAIVPPGVKEYFFAPAARVNLFPTTAVSPWASLGAGFAHISQSSTLIYGGTNPGKSTTSGVLEAGFGIDVKAWKRVILRGEVRDFWSGSPDFPLANTGKTRQHNYFVGGGVVWRF